MWVLPIADVSSSIAGSKPPRERQESAMTGLKDTDGAATKTKQGDIDGKSSTRTPEVQNAKYQHDAT